MCVCACFCAYVRVCFCRWERVYSTQSAGWAPPQRSSITCDHARSSFTRSLASSGTCKSSPVPLSRTPISVILGPPLWCPPVGWERPRTTIQKIGRLFASCLIPRQPTCCTSVLIVNVPDQILNIFLFCISFISWWSLRVLLAEFVLNGSWLGRNDGAIQMVFVSVICLALVAPVKAVSLENCKTKYLSRTSDMVFSKSTLHTPIYKCQKEAL